MPAAVEERRKLMLEALNALHEAEADLPKFRAIARAALS